MKNNKKAIVILGGMEPQASAHLVQILIDKSIKDFNAKNGDEFPEIILDSIPIPDFISDPASIPQALKLLKERVKILSKLKISSFALACNTAHVLFNKLQLTTEVPFISMIDETVDQVDAKGMVRVGLLASPSSIKFGIFQKALGNRNIEVIIPTEKEQFIVETIIRKVIRGKISELDQLKLISIADSLKKRGAQGIILGCTELPLVFPKRFTIPIFNSLEILANAALLKLHEGNTITS